MRIGGFGSVLLVAGCQGGMVGDGDGVLDTEAGLPAVGWRAALTGYAHDVGGEAVITDERTLELRGFTYDGGGINARVFLLVDGAPFDDTWELSDNLVGTGPYDGETLTLQLPGGAIGDPSWDSVALWCVPAGALFGLGVFEPPG